MEDMPQTWPNKFQDLSFVPSGASRMQENLLAAEASPRTLLRVLTALLRPHSQWGVN